MSQTTALRHRHRRHDGRTAPAARRGRRRRSHRAAARHGQRSERRRRAGRTNAAGDRHLPSRLGRRASSADRKRSASASSPRGSSQGAEYVDIEWRAHFDDLIARSGGRRIVLSAHDYHGVPIDLNARVHAMRSTGAEVVKMAATLTSLQRLRAAAAPGRRQRPAGRPRPHRDGRPTACRLACSPGASDRSGPTRGR